MCELEVLGLRHAQHVKPAVDTDDFARRTGAGVGHEVDPVSYTHLRAHETNDLIADGVGGL